MAFLPDVDPSPLLSLSLYSFLYQTSHFLSGFIGESAGQEKSLANSGMLANGPRTLVDTSLMRRNIYNIRPSNAECLSIQIPSSKLS